MADQHKNFSYSTVLTAPSPATSGTSLVLASGGGALMPTPPFNATVWATGANPLSSNAEIVRVTAISTDTLTITRSQESSSARTIVTGDQIAATITTKTLTDIENGYLPLAGGSLSGLLSPNANNTFDFGTSALYWANVYASRYYLNPTAYIDGGTAGQVGITGKLNYATGSTNLISINGSNAIVLGATTGSLAIGLGSIPASSTGQYNTALGTNTLAVNTTGDFNVAIGDSALAANIGGEFNMAVGRNSLTNNTSGSANVAVGLSALVYNGTGSFNIAIGGNALAGSAPNNMNNNTAIGYGAGQAANGTTGNVFIGFQAGASETGSGKLYIANSSTATPLIKGDFTAATIDITGALTTSVSGTGATNVATLGGTQSLTNKTLGNTNTATLKTSSFTLQDPTDATKQAIFDLSANTTGVTRTYPLPNANVMLVNISTAQTLSNKTLTAPVINNPTFSGYGGLSALTADTATLSTTETVLANITIPTAAVGTTYRITLQGTNTSSVANLSTFTLRAGTLGTTSDASIATATVTSAATGTAVPFRVVIEYTLRTNGATGNGQGMMQLVNNGTTGIAATATAVAALTTTATFATTTATKFDITYKSAATTTTSTFQNAIIEIVKP